MVNRIGIIGAMEVEVEGLKAQLENRKETSKAGMIFCEGILNGKEVTIVRSGVGKVNAAVCTQILIDVFHVEAVINTGVAGSLDVQINIGDIVISTDAVHHDVDATIFGYQPGEVPQMGILAFPADPAMADAACKVCERELSDIRVFRGRVCSGDQFIADQTTKDRIIREFGGMCAEMEGASIAHTCWLNGIPYVVIRAISDKADGSDEMDYPVFEAAAASRSLRLVEALLSEL